VLLTLAVIGAFYDTDRSDVSLGWSAYAQPHRAVGVKQRDDHRDLLAAVT
jgi:hypothetical protein